MAYILDLSQVLVLLQLPETVLYKLNSVIPKISIHQNVGTKVGQVPGPEIMNAREVSRICRELQDSEWYIKLQTVFRFRVHGLCQDSVVVRRSTMDH